jgi:diacylglycerol kinase
MTDFLRSRFNSFRYAFQGWAHVLRHEPNTWIHAFVSVSVILVAAWLRLPARDWAVLLLTIAMVWAAELFNTAIENIVDLVSPDEHPLAKVGKDVSAAGVLLTALTAIVIGFLILGPPLWAKLQSF